MKNKNYYHHQFVFNIIKYLHIKLEDYYGCTVLVKKIKNSIIFLD